jgi:hypothetical protein
MLYLLLNCLYQVGVDMLESVYEILRPLKTRTVLRSVESARSQQGDADPETMSQFSQPRHMYAASMSPTGGANPFAGGNAGQNPNIHAKAGSAGATDLRLNIPVQQAHQQHPDDTGFPGMSARTATYTAAAVPNLPTHVPVQSLRAALSPVPHESPKAFMLQAQAQASVAAAMQVVRREEYGIEDGDEDEFEDMDDDDDDYDDDMEHNLDGQALTPLVPSVVPSDVSPRVEASNPMMMKFKANAAAKAGAGGAANPITAKPSRGPSVFFADDDATNQRIAEGQGTGQKQAGKQSFGASSTASKGLNRMNSLSQLGTLGAPGGGSSHPSTLSASASFFEGSTSSAAASVAAGGRVPPAPRDILNIINIGGDGSDYEDSDDDNGEFKDNDDNSDDEDALNTLLTKEQKSKQSIAASGLLLGRAAVPQLSPSSSAKTSSPTSANNPFSSITLTSSTKASFPDSGNEPMLKLIQSKYAAPGAGSAGGASPGTSSTGSSPIKNPSVLQRKASFEMRKPLQMQNSAELDESLHAIWQATKDTKPTVPQGPAVYLPPKSPAGGSPRGSQTPTMASGSESSSPGTVSRGDSGDSPTGHRNPVKVTAGAVKIGGASSEASSSGKGGGGNKKVSFWQEMENKQAAGVTTSKAPSGAAGKAGSSSSPSTSDGNL